MPAEAFCAKRLLAPLALLGVAALLFFAPKLGVRWPCPVHTILHVPCPTCGMTRAARLAAHGDFAAATHIHPLWMLVIPFVATVAIVELAHYVRTGAWGGAGRLRGVRGAGYAVVGLLLLVWASRFLGAFGGPCPEP